MHDSKYKEIYIVLSPNKEKMQYLEISKGSLEYLSTKRTQVCTNKWAILPDSEQQHDRYSIPLFRRAYHKSAGKIKLWSIYSPRCSKQCTILK